VVGTAGVKTLGALEWPAGFAANGRDGVHAADFAA
jgi:hypothetical protein